MNDPVRTMAIVTNDMATTFSPPEMMSSSKSFSYTNNTIAKPTRKTRRSRSPKMAAFEGSIFQIQDGTWWKVLQPLSEVELQQGDMPCEGSQVFGCVSLDESLALQHGEVAVKLRFQVRATYETIERHEAELQRWKKIQCEDPTNLSCIERISTEEKALACCTGPSVKLNYSTPLEFDALDRLTSRECAYTPWLAGYARRRMSSKCHPLAIEGGYCVFFLMDKLDAKPMSYEEFFDKPLEEQNRICEAIKTAVMGVRACGVEPFDYTLSNFLWDEKKEHCYIVGFGNCRMPPPDAEPLAWDDQEFDYLHLI